MWFVNVIVYRLLRLMLFYKFKIRMEYIYRCDSVIIVI